jgi:phage head maturation protease
MRVLQVDHGRDARTGSVPIGSISTLTEDEKGLFVQARLFDNPVVEPIRQAIAGAAIRGMSFRFNVTREEWRDAEGKKLKPEEIDDLLWVGTEGIQRTIQEVELHELGPVVFPAYDTTSVGVRSMLSQLDPEERKALIKEVVAELRRLPDLTGRSTEAVDGGEPGAQPQETGSQPPVSRRRVFQDMRLATAGVITKMAATKKENK